ncbi:MFS transporter [Streptomyces fragilis]|uniref:MFS transporter n=1 Tax=Streptomyces fragilis TaxID=67301 RepID=UPI0024DE8A64|nr:MFS transporter [Streptomyces fragilis]
MGEVRMGGDEGAGKGPGRRGVAGERRLTASAVVNGIGSGMYIPFSLVFFHHVTGQSYAVVGAVLTVAGLGGMGLVPFIGTAVDRHGARRMLMLFHAIRCTGFLAYPFADSLGAFAGVALLTVTAERAYAGVQTVLVDEVARGADRDRLQARLRAVGNAGLGAGTLLVSLVVGSLGPAGYSGTALANAAAYAVAALLLRAVRPVREESGAEEAADAPAPGYLLVVRDRPFLVLTAANFFNALGYTALSVLFPLSVVSLGGADVLTGVAFAVNTVLCAAGGTYVGHLVRRSGARRTRAAALGALLFAAGFLTQLAPAAARPESAVVLTAALVGGVVVVTVGELVHSPAADMLAVSAAPAAVRGRYMAVYQLSWSLAKALAPALFTTLLALDGRVPWVFLIGTSLVAAGLLVVAERCLPEDAVRMVPAAERMGVAA